ncbi:aspartate aminotransferase family protein [Aestuariivirga sp.]|uniref:aspartate aminotransferase family protein n=1 Tax=Aestuariivirga sp. TaxID=2650926 RepID=UPI00301A5594
MSHIIHRSFRNAPATAVSGQGVTLRDSLGREYLDGSSGAAVSILGHGHPDVIAAMHAQIDRLNYAHTSFFTTEIAEELADELIRSAPQGLSDVYFVSGGSEAVEAALKMTRQYFLEIGQPQRTKFIARRQSYHGNTLGALAVGGNESRRMPYAPILIPVTHVSACYPYRDLHANETDLQYGQRLAGELEATILREGPESVMAFIIETVGGATAGVLTPVPGYLRAVREVLDRHGVLLILDEVMCGMGRTGTLYASEQEGVVPDLVTIAKGLGGGYQPIGAVLVQRKIVEAMSKGSGSFLHGHTYIGHPVACAAALAVQRVIQRDGLVQRVRENGTAFGTMLREQLADHPHVGDIRGRGLFWGIEFVSDRSTKAPFDPSLQIHAVLKKTAMKNGLLCYPMGGTIDGKRGDHVVLAPPYIATLDELQQIASRLATSVNEVLKSAATATSPVAA